MRTRKQEEKVIPTRTIKEWRDVITCDKCHKQLDPEDDGAKFPNEVFVYLNPQECIHQQFRRDYCTKCLTRIWEAICRAISADPDDMSGIED